MSRKKDSKARLEDVDTREVSLVDRPANQRSFLVIKREESMGKKRTARAVPANEVKKNQDENQKSANVEARSDDPTQVAKDGEGSFLDLLGIDDGQPTTGQPQSTGKQPAGSAQASTPQPAEVSQGGAQPAVEGTSSAPVQKANGVLGGLTQALQTLTDAVSQVKDLGDKPITSSIEKSINEVVKALSVGKVDAKSTADKQKQLGVAAGAAANAEDSDAALSPALEPAAKKFELFKASATDGADPEVVIKVGSKMKRSRLSKLKETVKSLSALTSEIEGVSKGAPASESVNLDPLMEKLDSLASAVKARFEALEEKTDKVSKRIETIENMRPAGNGEGDPDPVSKSNGEGLWTNLVG